MIGTTLAHYRITAALGAGGMGEVWRATDTGLGLYLRGLDSAEETPLTAGDIEFLVLDARSTADRLLVPQAAVDAEGLQ